VNLYIVHGWIYDISPWETVAKTLAEQGITAEILRVPGLTEPSDQIWDIKKYVHWADHNIPDGVVALGHSNGGRILMNLLSERPTKLKGLILLDSAGIYDRSVKRSTMKVVAKAFSPLKHVKPLRKLVHRAIGASDYDKAPENMKHTLHNMIMSDKQLDPTKVIVPTHIIWGDADISTPLRHGQELHRLIKGSRLIVKKGWPHSRYLEHPEELAHVIAESAQELDA